MAKIKFKQPGDNLIKLSSRAKKKKLLTTKILLAVWGLQTILTIAYLLR
ncbi:MAG: hypothetical protein RLZZ181_597 [Pseudomonadota bacterium]